MIIWLSVDLWFLPCVLIQHPKAPSCPQPQSWLLLMNRHQYRSLLFIQPWSLLAQDRTGGLLRRLWWEFISTHYVLLSTAWVHQFSATKSMKGSVMKQSDAAWFSGPSTPFLGTRPHLPVQSMGLGLRGWAPAKEEWTQTAQTLIQNLIFHRLEDKLL